MSAIKIKELVPDVNCQYGSPMGRWTGVWRNNQKGQQSLTEERATSKAYCRYVPFVDGCYDIGGAYWGMPANLYIVKMLPDDDGIEMQDFYRASSRKEAIEMAKKDYPNLKFYRK